MNTIVDEAARPLRAEDFSSEYERFAALVLTRVPNIGRAAAAHVFADSDVRELLGLPARAGTNSRRRLEPEELAATTRLVARRQAEILAIGRLDAPLFGNVELLGRRLALTAAERSLLVLAAVIESVGVLREACDELARHVRDVGSAARALGALTQQDEVAIRDAIASTGVLARSGLVTLRIFEDSPGLLALRHGLICTLADSFAEPSELLAQFALRAPEASLHRDDFAHIVGDFDLIAALLSASATRGERGINVMLYGPPGVGKTELARALADHAGVDLYELRHTSESGMSIRRARYSQLVVAQRLFEAARGVALVFDETEDLFPSAMGYDDSSSERGIGKASFNAVLETNPIPVIWISNAIDQIDPAYRRRFSVLLEVKLPSRSVRQRIAAGAFGELVRDERWIERISSSRDIEPSTIVQAARVANLVRVACDPADSAERVVRGIARGLGRRLNEERGDDTHFDRRFVNCDVNIDTLLEGMRSERRGTLLFHGPPGSGKSALARHLADLTERPLHVRRPSDLESPWVGVTEQNIARAFETAGEDGALLLLDEAESFLGDRRDSRARWEISQTNEMLTQIERFDGLLVCTTNLLARLDPAVLRRFDVKIAFDYLRPEQVRALFIATLEYSGLRVNNDNENALAHLDRLHRLTAGDFAAATRRFRRLQLPMSPDALLEAVTAEVAVRADGAVGRIGF